MKSLQLHIRGMACSFWGRLLSKASQHREEKRQQQSVTYRVPNMHCEHCVETIKQMLTTRFEDITVETDLDQSKVTIIFRNGHVNDSSLREALVEIGCKPETRNVNRVLDIHPFAFMYFTGAVEMLIATLLITGIIANWTK